MRGIARACVLGTLAVLAGCGSQSESNGLLAIGRNAAGLLRSDGVSRGILGAEGLTATDAQLRAFRRPLLKITLEKTGLSAAVGKADDKGAAVIWQSADGNQITLFNGLLISTKGFGNDLSSAKVPSVVAGDTGMLRENYYLGGDEVVRRFAYLCDYRDGGAQRINLLGLGFDTRLVTETCTGEEDSFTNRYWFNAQGGILKSQQRVSPEIGMLTIEFVPRDGGGTRQALASEAQPQVFILE
ncbi:YjbF family lipoprotein [Oceaniglobus trochenteri]|uniref:YjbF family lipoprotein n=1 Tax=Oceaniglobus trochenteri TaxID=2763260 RepID=UPI001CFF5F28|nr:YjbF family lipoprotein [Oceaniglobus trochenteri]